MCSFIGWTRWFAYISSVATAAALLACILIGETALGDVMHKANILRNIPKYQRGDEKNLKLLNAIAGDLAESLVIMVAGIVCLIAFIFSLMLCNGITKRQPGQLKAYLAFGVTLTFFVASAAIHHLRFYDPEPGRYFLIGCGLYLVGLLNVGVAYKKMLSDAANGTRRAPKA